MLTQDLINLKSLDDSITSSVSVSELLIAYGDCVPIGEEKCYWSLGSAGYEQLQSPFVHLQINLDWLQKLYLISTSDGETISMGIK